MKAFLFAVILIASPYLFAQANFLNQIDLHTYDNGDLGRIEVGVFKPKEEKKQKPLVLVLGGSGLEPTFKFNPGDGQVYCSGFWGFARHKNDFHIAYINKAGIPLYDTLGNNQFYDVSDFAWENNTLDWRAESASFAIDQLVKKLKPSEVIVVGHSQGGQVAPRVAVLNKKVSKVVIMSANSLDHIYDRILLARQQALNHSMTFDDAQYVVDSLLNIQKEIYNDPASTEKEFWGDSYKKWYSYSKTTPLENMLQLDIPILLIASGRDVDGSYIANTDYAALEFIRKGKTNLTYKVYPNYDHIYMETKWKYGEEIGLGFKANQVIKEVFEWVKK